MLSPHVLVDAVREKSCDPLSLSAPRMARRRSTFYDTERPHQSLNGHTPHEVYHGIYQPLDLAG